MLLDLCLTDPVLTIDVRIVVRQYEVDQFQRLCIWSTISDILHALIKITPGAEFHVIEDGKRLHPGLGRGHREV